jgi:hypothetical protein
VTYKRQNPGEIRGLLYCGKWYNSKYMSHYDYNDPEKIGIHMLEMLAKFRNEGIVE